MHAGLKTWNPYFGCRHDCYDGGCWAKRKLAHRMGARFKCSSCYDFKPHLHEERLNRIPSQPRIFVGGHCDQWGWWVSRDIILRILEVCSDTPKEMWFFETKNPRRYHEFLDCFPENTVLSATIETNRTYGASVRGFTPDPLGRFIAMRDIVDIDPCFPLHIAIEPVMDFGFDVFHAWMKILNPVKVAIGYDSLHNGLPEPPQEKAMRFADALDVFTEVERKGGMR